MSSGATSADVFYTPNGTTVSSKAFRITGYLEYLSGLAVEHHKTGEMVWLPLSDAAGDLFPERRPAPMAARQPTCSYSDPVSKKPGDVVQTAVATTSSVHGGTTSTSDVALGTSTINPLRILASGHWQTAASSTDALASLKIKRGGSTEVGPAVGIDSFAVSGAYYGSGELRAFDAPGSVSAQTYQCTARRTPRRSR